MRTSLPYWIGRNLRPGIIPGGFSEYLHESRQCRGSRPRSTVIRRHKEVIEAANRVLEKRVEVVAG